VPRRSNRTIARGRWALPVAALFVGVWGIGVAPAAAQKVVPTVPPPMSPKPQPPTGTGGGAGLAPSMPDFSPAPAIVAPSPSAPAAPTTVVPVAPAPLIRFRCEVPSGESTCKEPPPSDGGGSDETCNCARDFCYQDGTGTRVCEKAAN
jgi:hypothetical protein